MYFGDWPFSLSIVFSRVIYITPYVHSMRQKHLFHCMYVPCFIYPSVEVRLVQNLANVNSAPMNSRTQLPLQGLLILVGVYLEVASRGILWQCALFNCFRNCWCCVDSCSTCTVLCSHCHCPRSLSLHPHQHAFFFFSGHSDRYDIVILISVSY